MAEASFSAQTLDDVLREVITALLKDGKGVTSTKGSSIELFGVLLEITNPRARLVEQRRGERRSAVWVSFVGIWRKRAISASSSTTCLNTRVQQTATASMVGTDHAFFDWNGINQIQNVAALLTRKRSTRQAVVQLFAAQDIVEQYNDVPCTCCLQFVIREDKLNLMTSMRSNDAYKGLPHDIFCFTMLQEILARALNVEPGIYKHAVGSMHLYNDDRATAEQFLNEGWQSTETSMPLMPLGDPWPSVDQLLIIESALRSGANVSEDSFGQLHPYWADLARLLQVFRLKKNREVAEIGRVREAVTSNVYWAFIDKVRNDLEQM